MKRTLVISECMVKALAFDTRSTEKLIYQALMNKVEFFDNPKRLARIVANKRFSKEPCLRRQFRLNGSSISIVIKYETDRITIIPARNKVTMSDDHTKFVGEIDEAYGDTDTFLKLLDSKLLEL